MHFFKDEKRKRKKNTTESSFKAVIADAEHLFIKCSCDNKF